MGKVELDMCIGRGVCSGRVAARVAGFDIERVPLRTSRGEHGPLCTTLLGCDVGCTFTQSPPKIIYQLVTDDHLRVEILCCPWCGANLGVAVTDGPRSAPVVETTS